MGKGYSDGLWKGTKGSRFNATIHQGRQDKHIVGTNNYNQQIANGKNPSILKVNANTLLNEAVGKGYVTGNNKVSVDFGRIIGKYYDIQTGQYYDTTRATIHYDSKGNAHIVPARPRNYMKE